MRRVHREIALICRRCGSRIRVLLGRGSSRLSRECLVCPVCWATGPPLEDASPGCAVELFGWRSYRLLGCVRPEGPELFGASFEERCLARLLWELAGCPLRGSARQGILAGRAPR